jgi:hypothetical protein
LRERDATSLLAPHRTPIHRRADNSPFGTSDDVPLMASSDAVAAYRRCDGSREVLTSANDVVPAGQHAMWCLLGGAVEAHVIERARTP